MSLFSKFSISVVIALVIASAFLVWLWRPIEPKLNLDKVNGDVERGAYLARMSGCIACHTDFETSGDFLAGGKAIVTSFGEFRAPNLTSDKQHGIGNWTLKQFSAAVREGISPYGKPYYPAFPYAFYTQFTDQEIADLWAAFQTVPPIASPDPEQKIVFPFSIREGLNVWQALFFEPETFQADEPKLSSIDSELFARGQFIVEVAAHCGACHTPRNIFGALKSDQTFSGGVDAANGKVPSITVEALKLNNWTEDDLLYALQTGIKQDGDVFGGSMADIVEHGTTYLSEYDLKAIAHYLFNR